MIIQAADKAGIPIPRFCYHDKLAIAANCRRCLVEVEKMPKPAPACATPVIAWDHGSVCEVIDAGETGFIVSSMEEAVAAVPLALGLSRARIREVFDRRFSATTMAQNYLDVYGRLVEQPVPLTIIAA